MIHMKRIVSGKYEDALRERDDYYKKWDEHKKRRDNAYEQYRTAQLASVEHIQMTLERNLQKFSNLEFNVYTDYRWGDEITVNIKCNDRTKFEDTSALSWTYDVTLNEETGELEKSSSSWSGLKATTPEQMDSLRSTLHALEYLNSIDWPVMLKHSKVDMDDYRVEPMIDERSEYNKRVQEALFDDLAGTNKWILVRNFESSGYNSYIDSIYVNIVRSTPKQYVVRMTTKSGISNNNVDMDWTQRVAKRNIIPIKDSEGNYTIVEL